MVIQLSNLCYYDVMYRCKVNDCNQKCRVFLKKNYVHACFLAKMLVLA